MSPLVPDTDLWAAAAQGDRTAFGVLFRRHYALLYQYGGKICSDAATLEDAIQELFAELWQKQPMPAVQSVKAYLLQALKFKLYKSFRDRKPLLELMEEPEGFFEMGHDSFIAGSEEEGERTQKLLNALNRLPARQKEVIYLKIYKGLSYEEVSEVMALNYQVVRNLLCQALKTFRKLILPAVALLMMQI